MIVFSLAVATVLVALGAQLSFPRVWGRVGGTVAGLANLVVAGYAVHLVALDVLLALAIAFTTSQAWTLGPHALAWVLLGLHVVRRDQSVPIVLGRPPEEEPAVARWRAWRANVSRQATGRDSVEVLRGLVFRQVGGVSLRLDVYRPRGEEPHPSLLYLHGGAWVAGHRRLSHFMLHRFAAAGWTTFAASYRLGPRYPLPAALEDAKAALAFIRQHGSHLGAQAGRPIVWGESAGGHLAALVALTAGAPRWQPGFEEADTFVRGALLFSPVSDFLGAFDGDGPAGLKSLLEHLAVRKPFARNGELYRALDPMSCQVRDLPPVLLVHGAADSLVPCEMSRRFAQRILDAGGEARVVEVPGMPHGFELVPSPVQERVLCHALGFLDGIERSRALVRGHARR